MADNRYDYLADGDQALARIPANLNGAEAANHAERFVAGSWARMSHPEQIVRGDYSTVTEEEARDLMKKL